VVYVDIVACRNSLCVAVTDMPGTLGGRLRHVSVTQSVPVVDVSAAGVICWF